jgi:tetratricopeptide (TPR) repeat protein
MNEIIELENQADQFKAQGKFAEAVEKLEQILKLDANFVRAHLALSVLHYRLKNAEASVKYAERAVELEPGDPLNHTALSMTYQRAFELTRDPRYIHMAETAKERSHMMRHQH